jgi:OFA family oxalate/formate antiporter-like MFS transporter
MAAQRCSDARPRSQPASRIVTREHATHTWAAVAAVTILNLPLGSIYAFSVFLKPIEHDLGITRSGLSLVFGLASIGFTAGMNVAPLAFGRAPAWMLLVINVAAASIGIGVAASANGLLELLLGYSVLFGIGGGAAYMVLQQGANLIVQRRKGLLNGYIVGLYPAGAMIAAPLFGWANMEFGFRVTMAGLAVALLFMGLAATGFTVHAGTELPRRAPSAALANNARRTGIFVRLWVVFFLAAAAGLTVLSQAAGIIAAYHGTTATALAATTAITGAIALARVTGGWLVDRFAVPLVSASAHGLAATGAIVLTLWPDPLVAAFALGLIGMGYGFVSGATAGGIALYWPPVDYGRIASRLYIAWCVAAVTLPILAGYLFDITRGYHAAVIIAGGGNLLGLSIALGLPRQSSRQVTLVSNVGAING